MIKLTEYKLSDLYKMDSGIGTSKEQAGHGAPFISFSDIFNNTILPEKLTQKMDTTSEEQEKYSVKKGDILLTRTSETIDELAMSSVAIKDYPNATFSGFAKRLRPIQNNITYDKYMAFLLRSKYFRDIINAKTIMTLRASFNEDIFRDIKLLLPSYEEQVKIGDFLYTIEKMIRSNNKMNYELEQFIEKIYDYWFLQFDFPDKDGKPYKSSGKKMVWNNVLKKEIPEGWKVQNLKDNDLTKILSPGINYFEKEKKYLATADVAQNSIIGGNNVTYNGRESRANMQPYKNTIWFAKMKNSVKHIFVGSYAYELINEYIFSTGFLGLELKEEKFYEYVCSFVNSDFFEMIKNKLAHGATQEAVNNDDIKFIPVIIPSHEILSKYHKTTFDLFKRIYLNNRENERLRDIRDFLLPLLMNGQITFKD